ncbi:MAG: hypothetical protein HY035_11795 [Nitrospirae bacterium]|nr:hypothetical protein [Nitrospirota bacterium]MBI3379065.1 hypothetical protein [Nitrospirota bacterium]
MKKLILVIAITAIFATGSMVYAGQFGPPEPAAKDGKVALGVGYFYSSAKLKPKNTVDFKEREANQNQTYLQLSYGIIKNWEAYLRVGGADIKVKKFFDDRTITNVGPVDLKDSLKPFGTLGIKGVIYESDNKSFGIGPFIQTSVYSSYKDEWTLRELGWSDSGYAKAKWKKPWDINLGISAQAKIGEVILYGGPAAFWNKAKAEEDIKNFTTGSGGIASTTYKEKNNIGGFAGVRVPLGKGLSLEVEGQMKSKFSMGGALTYSF